MYTNILFATDLSNLNLQVGVKAQAFAKMCTAKLSIVHVVEPPIVYSHDFSESAKQLEMHLEQAKSLLDGFSQELQIKPENRYLISGNTKIKIADLASELKADLIIVGSHGVGGFSEILGSTAQNIILNAGCDVLTIQAQNLPTLKESKVSFYAQHFEEKAPHLKAGYERDNTAKLKDIANPRPNTPQYGSQQGFKQAVSRGPKPGKRPPGTPYGRGEREEDS